MTTAELIKKKEEEKNNPSQSPNTSPFKPAEGMNMAESRMAGNGVSSSEIKADVPATGKTDNRVSLYEVGKNSGGTNIGEAEKMLKGNVSPITTPEYEKFRNEVIGAQQFGVEIPEQAEARERRDFIKQGLTGFTDGLTALANLYYTTKWAPNQKLVSQMPELSKRLYAERLERDKNLENFRAWQRAKADKAEDRAYQEKVTADTRAYQDAIRNEQAAENRRRWEYTTQKQEEATAKADARYEDEQAYKREQDALANKHRTAQLAETQRYHNAMIENRANGNKSGSGKLLRIQKPNGEPMVFRKDDLENGVNLAYIYNSLPDDYKVRDKNDILNSKEGEDGEIIYPISKNPTKYEMMTAIGSALQSGAIQEIAEDIQVGSTNPIHSNTQQGSAQANVEQKNSGGSKWDSYDITDGKKAGTDFSKQKRPSKRGTEEQTTPSQMSNVSAESVPNAPTIQHTPSDSESNKPKGIDRYKAMVDKDNKESESERKAKEERIKRVSAKRANTVQEAKNLRKELNAILNDDLPEFDIEKFISDNNIGFLDAIKYRMQYADDDKVRAEIKRKIQRLNNIIGNG